MGKITKTLQTKHKETLVRSASAAEVDSSHNMLLLTPCRIVSLVERFCRNYLYDALAPLTTATQNLSVALAVRPR